MSYKTILFYSIFILLLIIILSLYQTYLSLHPPRIPNDRTPADLGLKYDDITLTTEDNLKLSAWYIPSKNKTSKSIILAHGHPFNKANILDFAPFLHQKYNLLFFDFRAMGDSEGNFISGGYHEQKDLKAAINYLKKEKNISNIGALGVSMGAAVIILEAAHNKEIKAIVADSSYKDLHTIAQDLYKPFSIFKYPFIFFSELFAKIIYSIDIKETSPVTKVKNVKAPMFIVHGEIDYQISVESSKAIYENANQPKELWIAKDTNHVQTHFKYKQEYEKKVLEFFDKYLK